MLQVHDMSKGIFLHASHSAWMKLQHWVAPWKQYNVSLVTLADWNISLKIKFLKSKPSR